MIQGVNASYPQSIGLAVVLVDIEGQTSLARDQRTQCPTNTSQFRATGMMVLEEIGIGHAAVALFEFGESLWIALLGFR